MDTEKRFLDIDTIRLHEDLIWEYGNIVPTGAIVRHPPEADGTLFYPNGDKLRLSFILSDEQRRVLDDLVLSIKQTVLERYGRE